MAPVWSQHWKDGVLTYKKKYILCLADNSIDGPHSKTTLVPESRDGSHHPIISISCIGFSVYHLHLSHSLFLESSSQYPLEPTRNTKPYHHFTYLLFPLQSLCFLVNNSHFQLDEIRYGILKTFCLFSINLQHSLSGESKIPWDFKSKSVN